MVRPHIASGTFAKKASILHCLRRASINSFHTSINTHCHMDGDSQRESIFPADSSTGGFTTELTHHVFYALKPSSNSNSYMKKAFKYRTEISSWNRAVLWFNSLSKERRFPGCLHNIPSTRHTEQMKKRTAVTRKVSSIFVLNQRKRYGPHISRLGTRLGYLGILWPDLSNSERLMGKHLLFANE